MSSLPSKKQFLVIAVKTYAEADTKSFLILTNFSWFCYFLQNVLPLIIDFKKNNFMAPFYGWGSTASRLEPLRGGSLLFTTKFPKIPGTLLIDLGRMNGWVDLGGTQWFWTRDPGLGIQHLNHCREQLRSEKVFTITSKWNHVLIKSS